ncbi:conserved Plasmodium protein, unknown function [Plasmodium gallinaceum]|uniref:Uncharacterized protein n=1 Tax=Plasmodium gallinaceum TaxID=5849 RepID=A0A1J1GYM9_PLAGA|nr:conserved Plasmodium protein, unknown function [Plasmodium gallinaceum]CRG97573.1 conserved Plasmodium protein, unknown function [Plasmodium gallinaceum]
MQEKYKKESHNKEVNEVKNNVFSNEINKSNSQIINENPYELCDQPTKYINNCKNIIKTSEKNILYTEKSNNSEKNNLSTYSEESVDILKFNEKDIYSSGNNNIIHSEKNGLSKKKDKILKKNNSSPCSFNEEINYIPNTEKKNGFNEKFKVTNKVNNNGMKITKNINEILYYKQNSNNITMKNEDIEKKLSFSELINDSKDREMKEIKNKYDINIKNENNRQNDENIKNNENMQNDVYTYTEEKKQSNALIKKNKNKKNSITIKKYENTHNTIVKNYSKIKNKENIKKDQIKEKTNSARNGHLYYYRLKKKKKKKNTDSSYEVYANNNLDIKNNYDIEKNKINIQKENTTQCFKSYKINNELNVLNSREKNSEIITSFKNFSKNAKKENIFNSDKIKNNKKKILHSNTTNSDDLKNKSSEEIMIQKIFINESDTNDKVQKKIHLIEQNMEKKEDKTSNNNIKIKGKIISEKKNEKEKENLDSEIELFSGNSSILSNDFTKLEEREKNVKNLTYKNENSIDESDSIIFNKHEKEDMENLNIIYDFPIESDTNEQKKELNKNVVHTNGKLKKKDSMKDKELKKSNSNYSKELMDIKIYDDSEIDEVKNNELESFWNNNEVSSILNEVKYDSHKYSDEANDETVIWNSENYNIVEISNKKFPSYKKKKKIRVKRCESDSTSYKRKNDIILEKKNSIDDIIIYGNMGKNDRDTCNPSLNNNENYVNKKNDEDINIASKLDVIKSKLALNNNIDIDSVNFECFDIYQINFEKLGLNVDNLDKEEKYILMLYISEKKLEFVWNEREAFKRAHSNIKNFQANQNKIKGIKNECTKSGLLNENNINDNFNNRKSDKNNNRLTDIQYFKINSINDKNGFENNKNNKFFKLLTENKNENEILKFSTSESSDLSIYKSTNEQKIFPISESNLYNKNISSEVQNNDNLPKYGFFFDFYHKLLKKYKILNNIDNFSNEKVLLEKFLRGCIYLFFQDEYIDNFLKYYEDIKKAENKEDIIFKKFLCVEYMYNSFQNIYHNKENEKNEEIILLSLNSSDIMREIMSKFILNDNLVSKLKQIQIINKILKDEVRTYAIKVANYDIYFDVEQHFIEEAEKVVVGKDIGFFNISLLDKNYKYNYYLYQEEAKLNEQNKNSIWSYFVDYFNDLFYWNSDKNENDFPIHEQGEKKNKDINLSKRFSRNFMKLNETKEENNNFSEHKTEKKNFLNNYEENKDTIKKEEERDISLNNNEENKDILINEIKDINPLKIKEEIKKKCLESKSEPTNLIENQKLLSNLNKNETILSNSTNIEDCLMESNISSVDNFVSENSNVIKLDTTNNNLDNKNTNHFNNEEVKYSDDNDNTIIKNYIDISKRNLSIKSNDDKKYPNNFDCKNENSLKDNQNITENKNMKHKNKLAHLVAFQYRGSLPKDEISDLNKMDKNLIGSYFSYNSNDNLIAVHIKNESIEQFLNAHFIIERCRKYNKEIKKSYVHILNSKTKQYLAVDLENKKIIFTNKYDDIFYIDEFDVKNRISTYFELQSISDMMKNILIEDIIQSVANIMLN